MCVAVVCGERVAVLRLQRRELARVLAEGGFGGGEACIAGFGECCEGGADAREGQAVRECVEIEDCVGNELWGMVLVALCRGERRCHWGGRTDAGSSSSSIFGWLLCELSGNEVEENP
jgi:hypothetical protein